MISDQQLADIRRQLKPGDILIERQNWYLSRAFMPGFWAHAALYVGTTNDLVRLGLADDPRVQKHWKEFAARNTEGHEHVILEAVPEGVRVTTLEHCLGVADAAAVLRPRLSEEQIERVKNPGPQDFQPGRGPGPGAPGPRGRPDPKGEPYGLPPKDGPSPPE